jgi:peptidoglycan/LPS O-acetylase OafA/YrhL
LIVCALGIAVPVLGATIFEFTTLKELPWDDPNSMHRWLYRNPAVRLADFVLGIGLYIIFKTNQWIGTARHVAGAILATIGLVATVYFMTRFGATHWTLNAAYVAPFALIIFGVALLETGDRPIHVRAGPLVLLGQASYAFYLIHAEYGIKLFAPLQGILGLGDLAHALLVLCLITGLSILLYWYVERVSQKVLRDWWFTRSPRSVLANAPGEGVKL